MEILQICALVLSALLAENLMLVYCLGVGTSKSAFRDPVEGRRVGVAITIVMVVAGVLSRVIDTWLVNFRLGHLSLILFALLVPAVSYSLQQLLRFFLPELCRRLDLPLRNAMGNAAVLGVILIASQRGYSVMYTFIFALFGGIGVTLALISFAGLLDEIRLDRCPKCFRGVPICLVTAALMALSMVGFYGLNIT